MKRSISLLNLLLATGLLIAWTLPVAEAKSYSSGGGRSYSSPSRSSNSGGSRSSSSSSSSTRSSGSGGSSSSSRSSPPPSASKSSSSERGSSKSFTSGSGRSYGASSGSTEPRKGYTAAKSYSSGAGHKFVSDGAEDGPALATTSKPERAQEFSGSSFSLDSAAARAKKEEASRRDFAKYKEASAPPKTPLTAGERPPIINASPSPSSETPVAAGSSGSYRVKPPPLPAPDVNGSRRPVYVPDAPTVYTRSRRMQTVFVPYATRPTVIYRDSYNSLFWWWLLDRSVDDRAYWAYHHRYDMDPARYQALVADNRELESRIQQLETNQVARDPSYVPPNIDRDLMYSNRQITQAYSNRPTTSGSVAFWVLAVPTILGAGAVFIWLIFFKRWQPSTA